MLDFFQSSKRYIPSPVTTSPSLKLLLGPKMPLTSRLNASKLRKNEGFTRLLSSCNLLCTSGSPVGGGRANASKPLKKLKMLLATFCPSSGNAWALSEKTCKNMRNMRTEWRTQTRRLMRCTKAVFRCEGLLTYVNNNRNESSNVIF